MIPPSLKARLATPFFFIKSSCLSRLGVQQWVGFGWQVWSTSTVFQGKYNTRWERLAIMKKKTPQQTFILSLSPLKRVMFCQKIETFIANPVYSKPVLAFLPPTQSPRKSVKNQLHAFFLEQLCINPPALPACLVVWGLMTDCLSVLCFCLYSLS